MTRSGPAGDVPTGSTLGIPTVDRFEGRRAAAHPLIEMGIPISVAPSCRGWRRRFRCPKRRVSPELELAVAGIPTTEIVQARQDENTCREDLSPLDLIEMGRRIEALEGPKAKERQKDLGKSHGSTPSGKFPEGSKGEAIRESEDVPPVGELEVRQVCKHLVDTNFGAFLSLGHQPGDFVVIVYMKEAGAGSLMPPWLLDGRAVARTIAFHTFDAETPRRATPRPLAGEPAEAAPASQPVRRRGRLSQDRSRGLTRWRMRL